MIEIILSVVNLTLLGICFLLLSIQKRMIKMREDKIKEKIMSTTENSGNVVDISNQGTDYVLFRKDLLDLLSREKLSGKELDIKINKLGNVSISCTTTFST